MKRKILWFAAFVLMATALAAGQVATYSTTANFGLKKPDTGTTNWATLINGDLDQIDSYFYVLPHAWTALPPLQLQTASLYVRGASAGQEASVIDSPAGTTADLMTWRVNGVTVADVTSTGAFEVIPDNLGSECGFVFLHDNLGTRHGGGGGSICELENGAMAFTSGPNSNGNQVFNALASGQHVYQYGGVTKQFFDASGLKFNNAQAVYFKDTGGVDREVFRGSADNSTAIAGMGAGVNFWSVGFGSLLARIDPTGLFITNQIQLNSTATPGCDASHRGQFNYVAGGAGVKDSVQVCAKDAADAYAWRTVY